MGKISATVLIGPPVFGVAGSRGPAILRRAGLRLVRHPFGRPLRAEEVVRLGRTAAGILAGTEPLTSDVLARLPALRVISRLGSGLDSVDVDAARRRRIAVLRTPDEPAGAVAEFTLALILDALRHVVAAATDLRAGRWRERTGRLLMGKTVGIVGMGRIGRRVARLVRAFGARVVFADPIVRRAAGARRLPLDRLLAASDVVTLHAPATPATRRMIGERALARMKPSAVLVNTARGALVDERALLAALRSGRLGAAALDVFGAEPYRGPLARLPNVVATPHIASNAVEARIAMEERAAENLVRALRGRR